MTEINNYATREDIERANAAEGRHWSDAIDELLAKIDTLTKERDAARREADANHRRAEILSLEDRRHVLILTDVVEAHGRRPDGHWPLWNELGPAVRALRERAEAAEQALAAFEDVRRAAIEQLAIIEAEVLEGQKRMELAEHRAEVAELALGMRRKAAAC